MIWVSFWTVSWQWLHTSRLFAVQVFSSYVSCGQFADLWRPRRHVPYSRPSLVVVWTTATLFWPGSMMFIFSHSSICRMRQPVWSPGLVVTTTSHRFLLAYSGFQYASESATRRRCLCRSVYTMQPLATWLTCVCRLWVWVCSFLTAHQHKKAI